MALKIGVVTARFNSEVTDKLEAGALDYFTGLDQDVEVIAVKVPGAVEIPLACQALIDQGCLGVVALGAVIRGDTSHYDYVCNSVERGITALMLETKTPIGFGILTTENDQQAMDRAGGSHGNKGAECAEVVLEMIGLLQDLRASGGKKAAAKKSSAGGASAGRTSAGKAKAALKKKQKNK